MTALCEEIPGNRYAIHLLGRTWAGVGCPGQGPGWEAEGASPAPPMQASTGSQVSWRCWPAGFLEKTSYLRTWATLKVHLGVSSCPSSSIQASELTRRRSSPPFPGTFIRWWMAPELEEEGGTWRGHRGWRLGPSPSTACGAPRGGPVFLSFLIGTVKEDPHCAWRGW